MYHCRESEVSVLRAPGVCPVWDQTQTTAQSGRRLLGQPASCYLRQLGKAFRVLGLLKTLFISSWLHLLWIYVIVFGWKPGKHHLKNFRLSSPSPPFSWVFSNISSNLFLYWERKIAVGDSVMRANECWLQLRIDALWEASLRSDKPWRG